MMQSSSYEKELAALIDPSLLRLYLEISGWQETSHNERFAYFNKEVSGQDIFSVELPLDKESKKFSVLIKQVFEVLEKIEGRSQLQVIQLIKNIESDTIIFEFNSETRLKKTTVPLDEVITAIQNIKDIFLWSASSLVKASARYNSPDEKATAYAKKLRIDQSPQPSKYQYKILSPSSEAEEMLSLSQGVERNNKRLTQSESFERKVVKQLILITSLVINLSEDELNRDVEFFESLVDKGVSYNICCAVLNLFQLTQGDIRLSVAWSPLISKPKDVPEQIVLFHRYVPVFEILSQKLFSLSSNNSSAT